MNRFIALAILFLLSAASAQAEDIYKRLEPLQLEFFSPSDRVFFLEVAALSAGSLGERDGAHKLGYGGNLSFSGVAYSDSIGIRPALDLTFAYSDDKNRKNFSANGLGLVYLDWGYDIFMPFIGLGGGWAHIQEEIGAVPAIGTGAASAAKKIDKGGAVAVGDIGASIVFSKHFGVLLSYRYLYGFSKINLERTGGKTDISTHQVRVGLRLRF